MSSMLALGNQLLGRLKQSRKDDDWVDRMVYWTSPCLFTLLALIIGAKQFVGKPIQCWPPKEFQRQWIAYAESYCFVENTYFVSMQEQFPMGGAEREERELSYYQWVFFLLLGQALLLMVPKFLWNAFNWKTGFNIHTLVERSHALNMDGTEQGRMDAGQKLGNRIQRNLELKARNKIGRTGEGDAKRVPDYLDWDDVHPSHCFVSLMYLLFKLLNLCLAGIQLYLLNHFMAPEGYTYWGWEVLRNLMAGQDWTQSGMFPRVTFCDFDIRQAAQHLPHHRFTLQCVLMINMFNEKVFLFLWFWLLGLCLLVFFNLLLWLYRVFYWPSSDVFILNQMRLTTDHRISESDFRNFVRHGLSHDGVTVLRLISSNCGDLLVLGFSSLLVSYLWTQYEKGIFAGKKMKSVMRGTNNPNFVEPRGARNANAQ